MKSLAETPEPDILVIDNYDSFTFNLVHYLMELGCSVAVERNDALSAKDAVSSGAKGMLISPGPCTPNEAGISLDLVGECAAAQLPLLGVCLGHQSIGQYFGAKVERGGLMHGKTSQVSHDASGVFEGLPSPFQATRYHSLIVRNVPDALIVNATSGPQTSSDDNAEDCIMGLRHESLPIHSVQFHPESIATEHGHALLANFARMCGLTPDVPSFEVIQ
jgi:anthranilate synthase component 2